MTEILLSTDLSHDTSLQKIGSSIYFDPKTKHFYRLSFLSNGVVFHNNDVIQPLLSSLTKIDPYFLAINKLANSKLKIDNIPHYLQHLDFRRIADEDQGFGQSSFILNQVKVFDFLQRKVTRLNKCIELNDFEKNTFKTEGSDYHYITPEVITILKTEINNHSMVDKFAKERYTYVPIRRHLPEEDEPSNNFGGKGRSKPKKDNRKEEPKLGHNQKTLNAFFNSKSKKQGNDK